MKNVNRVHYQKKPHGKIIIVSLVTGNMYEEMTPGSQSVQLVLRPHFLKPTGIDLSATKGTLARCPMSSV